MKQSRSKISKSSRAAISGIMIGIACLFALAMSYEEARDNLLRFFGSTLLLLALVMGAAIVMVALIRLIRMLLDKITNRGDDSDRQ